MLNDSKDLVGWCLRSLFKSELSLVCMLSVGGVQDAREGVGEEWFGKAWERRVNIQQRDQ